MNEKQTADYRRLKSFYPYRLFFLVQMPDEQDATVWCLRDRRVVNKALREGATVMEIK